VEMNVIDCRGMYCPLPILELAKALRGGALGDHVELWATDWAAQEDVSAFCRAAGHELLSTDIEADVLRFRIRIGR